MQALLQYALQVWIVMVKLKHVIRQNIQYVLSV